MPDISKCTNDQCPIREKCYRFTSEPNEYGQSYSYFTPTVTERNDGGKDIISCGMFLKENGDD